MRKRKSLIQPENLFLLIVVLYILIGVMETLSPYLPLLFSLISIAALISFSIYLYSKKSKRLNKFHSQNTLKQIDAMTGHQFEHFIGELYHILGYKTTVTRGSNDDGGDIIIRNRKESICLQAKRYNSKVTKKAVQEAYAAKTIYHTTRAAVITNNYFTKPTIEFAHKLNVELIDRDKLSKLIYAAQKKAH